ncbi:DUF6489 family protein [Thiocapsa roseopersicina]|uniref:Uncharacterized protein n=1 Tax=Thiocapsa roseopersicina TaxID=1058 RepID=A0A1H2VI99_THIRO|nr:DUF6489 family protein [Thiocapsa roseopersicina]SDW68086.1 hypothetical protein SAMN05421783_10733 [Thiocapsa roseopersicina]
MKMSFDVEMTPEEMRKLLGLPDVEAFQRQLMDDIRERMVAGTEGYDPIKLFQPYVTGTMASWDMFQKMLTNATSMSSGTTGSSSESSAAESTPRRK